MCDCTNTKQPERKPHVHAAVIKAWADGAEIESSINGGLLWRECSKPHWFVDSMYRIKPEPKPLTDLEKYGVEVGDVWVTRGQSTTYIVKSMTPNGKRASTATVGSVRNGSVDCDSLPLQTFERDTLLFRRGVVNRL